MADDIENKIKKEWITQALGDVNLSLDEKIDDSLLEDETVVLIASTNMFGDPIYVYIKVSMRNFGKLRDTMISGQNFSPSDFGEVLAAGRDTPPQTVVDEMRVKYKMVDIPKPANANQAGMPKGFTQPKFFDDYDS